MAGSHLGMHLEVLLNIRRKETMESGIPDVLQSSKDGNHGYYYPWSHSYYLDIIPYLPKEG